MPLFGWMLMYFTPNGHESMGQIFNALVHAIMYSYYFLAAMEVDKKFLWWKRYLTQLQLLQFLTVFVKGCSIVRRTKSNSQLFEHLAKELINSLPLSDRLDM